MDYGELQQAYDRLLKENAALRRELAQYQSSAVDSSLPLSTTEKIRRFRSCFRGRDDVYAVRFTHSRTGKSGYAPALRSRSRKRPYQPGDLLPLSDYAIYTHLKGDQTLGLYPLLLTEETWLLAVDFDKIDWLHDALAYLDVCRAWNVPASLERSRSGHGGHVWIFFEQPVPARLARRLGTQILTEASRHMGRPRLDSYDRFFPNQDTMPQGGFGNLIALPLQGKAVKDKNSVFIRDDGTPYPNQWEYLRQARRMTLAQLQEHLATDGASEWRDLGLADPSRDAVASPLKRSIAAPALSVHPVPLSIDLIVNGRVEIPTEGLSQRVLYDLARLAAFPNPEFYRRQSLHFSTWNTPRILSLADDLGHALALPRALLDEAIAVLEQHGIRTYIDDQRTSGTHIAARFTAQLQPEQQQAAQALLAHESGILDAATGFGKTLVAAYLIAQRQLNTLVLVPNRELLSQWIARLSTCLAFEGPNLIGQIGGGKQKSTGIIDVATLQTVQRSEYQDLLAQYGVLIVDECHHMASPSYESILRRCPSRFRLGLSATPMRKDGHHPIIFMHLSPIRFTYDTKTAVKKSAYAHYVRPRFTTFTVADGDSALSIQHIFKHLALDGERNHLIAKDIRHALAEGRNPLVLTQRTQQRDLLAELLSGSESEVIKLSSQPGAKKRVKIRDQLAVPPPPAGRVLLATGRLVGEGFDLPRLDTLFLAAPVSWRNVIKQYMGRLHRAHPDKREVIVYDYVDAAVPQLERMYRRRASSYRAFGYHIMENFSEEHVTS